MKRFLIHAATGALVLALAFAYGAIKPAHAGDRWNDSGFSLDHHFYSDERFQPRNNGGPQIIVVPNAADDTRVDEAVHRALCDAAISRMVARGVIEQAPECAR